MNVIFFPLCRSKLLLSSQFCGELKIKSTKECLKCSYYVRNRVELDKGSRSRYSRIKIESMYDLVKFILSYGLSTFIFLSWG